MKTGSTIRRVIVFFVFFSVLSLSNFLTIKTREVTICGKTYDKSIEYLIVSSTDFLKLDDYSFLNKFDELKTVDLCTLNVTPEKYDSIVSALNNDSTVIWRVPLFGKKVMSDTKKLFFSSEPDEKEIKNLSYLNNLEKVKVGNISSVKKLNDILNAIREGSPNAKMIYSTNIYGVDINNDSDVIYLNNINIENTQDLKTAIALFPNVKKYEMCDCGLSDDELGALREEYPEIEFVWMLHILKYNIRTDAQCFSTLVSDWVGFGDENVFAPLFKYCTELRALDLGHWDIKDISGIANLKHLQVLIISDNKISDLTPLSGLTDMEYLDLHRNEITDLTPLLSLQNLEVLLAGANPLKNPEILVGLKNLKKLHLCRSILQTKAINKLNKDLPADCKFYYKEENYMTLYSGHANNSMKKQFFRWKSIKEYRKYDDVVLYDVRPYTDKER